jgi:uncharacterized protein YcbX
MNETQAISPKETTLRYRNPRGKEILVRVSLHAKQRFWNRWNALYPHSPLDYKNVDAKLAEYFGRSVRLTQFSRKITVRLARYGKDTLFFKTNGFTFIVQDATLLTVEISDRGKRHLNKERCTLSVRDAESPKSYCPTQPR